MLPSEDAFADQGAQRVSSVAVNDMVQDPEGLTPLDTVLDALVFAADWHNGQRRKDALGSPVINHPIKVAQLLGSCGISDATVLSAAVLHDVVNDTDATFEMLEARFGTEITTLVRELTQAKGLKRDQRRQELLDSSLKLSRSAALIRLADKICKLEDVIRSAPVGWSRQRRRDYSTWVRESTRSLRGRNARLDTRLDEALALAPV